MYDDEEDGVSFIDVDECTILYDVNGSDLVERVKKHVSSEASGSMELSVSIHLSQDLQDVFNVV